MSLRFHEIAEGDHRILNPFSPEKLRLLGEICRLRAGQTQLDLASGKGEMLCQWASRHGIRGIGVDLSVVFSEAARARAAELGVSDRVSFVQSDAATYMKSLESDADIVSCIGATWIGGGLTGTIDLMKTAVRGRDSLLLIGEPFWHEPPTDEANAVLTNGGPKDLFVSLEETLERFEAAGLEVVEMLNANLDDWDRYEASQWITGRRWLDENADDPDAPAFTEWIGRNRRAYLKYGRRYLGWGVFVLRS